MQQTLSESKEKKRLLKEEVTDEDIASVVASWTGIPVSKMLEGGAFIFLVLLSSEEASFNMFFEPFIWFVTLWNQKIVQFASRSC